MDFVKAKLIGNRAVSSDVGALLACLAVRFSLEFNPKTPQERSFEITQVEQHMRICLSATPGFHSLVTVSASEPLLAEAASIALPYTDVQRSLANALDTSCIHHGDRGELAAMVIIMAARDKAAATTGEASVVDFMEALLPESYFQILSQETPTISGSERWDKEKFSKTFKKSRMWFNHFIKIEDSALINVKFLWRLICRGAAILCANNQRAIDILLPVVYKNDKIGQKNTTVILIQVKNDVSFTSTPRTHLFKAMDPFNIGVFSNHKTIMPIVRMVFALGAKMTGPPADDDSEQAVKVIAKSRTSTRHSRKDFTSWDIWFTGLSGQTFGVVTPDQEGPYQTLLGRRSSFDDAYELKGDSVNKVMRRDVRRAMHPGSECLDQHFKSYIKLD